MEKLAQTSRVLTLLDGKGYPRAVALVYVCCAMLFGGLLALELRWIDVSTAAVARERGAALFGLVETMRDWNARHGGVYVPVTDATQPNPYLEHPRRDLLTADGEAMTMVNPAFMTRQIAELAAQTEGIRLHITSLNPIRPENAPDAWEAEALRDFEKGRKEVLSLVEQDGVVLHRYMAPLRVAQPCLQCHEAQGYRLGDIRGGISVDMPAQALVELRDVQAWRTIMLHLTAFVLAAGMIHGLLGISRRYVRSVQRINSDQERLIRLRTQELADSNVSLAVEVEERRLSELRLAVSEARYRAVFESAAEGIMVLDADLRVLQVNPAFSIITGYSSNEVIGRHASLFSSGRHDASFFAEIRSSLEGAGSWRGEIWSRHKSGHAYVQWVSIVAVEEEGTTKGYVATMTDITQRKVAEEQVRYRADHDALTGLPNRGLFEGRLAATLAIAHRNAHRFAVLFVDLDFFKAVNDRLGHLAGDALLIETARRLLVCVRESDTVARLGGDEFAILLTEVADVAAAEEVAERVCASLARPFLLEEGEAVVACSVGLALFPDHAEDVINLQRCADRALYAAKRGGRSQYRVYVAEMNGDGRSGE
jgi:diguanylate cyclase (GGDEF)-like protein/PAS domain S-box-containing protein